MQLLHYGSWHQLRVTAAMRGSQDWHLMLLLTRMMRSSDLEYWRALRLFIEVELAVGVKFLEGTSAGMHA